MLDAKNHLVTIIYDSNYDDANGQIMYGDDERYNHATAIDQIEKIMAYKFDWPQISFKERLSQEKVKIHNKVGNIVIENEENFGDGSKLWVFLPEILNDERKELIKTFINENREDIRELSTYNKEADDFIEINIEDFLHTKVKCFTITGQKDDSNEEID